MQASAAKLYINTAQNASWWTNVRVFAYNSSSDDNGWPYSETGVVSSTETFFGKEWYVFDMGNYSNAIVQYFESSDHSITNQTTDITNITGDRFIFIPGTQTNGKWEWYENGYTFRSNVLNNWDDKACNMTIVNSNTLSYTLTKSVIEGSGVDKIWFRILNQEGQLYPNADGTTLSLPSSTTDYYNNFDNTTWSYGIDIPSYNYDEIVITASLNGTTWTVSADAYISKTLAGPFNGTYYATFGTTANVDFSNVEGLTAKKLKVNSGVIEETDATTLYGGEGALLSAETAGPFLIPVAASATEDADNQLVAIPEKVQLAQTNTDGSVNYILTQKDGDVAFRKVNPAGSWCAAGSAYLKVPVSNAPEYISFGGTTGIVNLTPSFSDNADIIYDLNGRRIVNPTKGLYIVNGKKVIIK